jgi:hypothetical protein
MNQPEPNETLETTDFQNAPTLTADELALVMRTPNPEEALLDIEEHLRDLGMYSDQ